MYKRMAESIKSRYKPSYPQKYKGNPNNIICRSSWERRFCRWCDLNENIISWASEEFSIPYVSPVDNRVHRYYPDYLIKVKESDGKVKTYVVEVKPKKQTAPPKKPKDRLNHIFMSVRCMQSTRQVERLMSFVRTIVSNSKSSPKRSWVLNESFRRKRN